MGFLFVVYSISWKEPKLDNVFESSEVIVTQSVLYMHINLMSDNLKNQQLIFVF